MGARKGNRKAGKHPNKPAPAVKNDLIPTAVVKDPVKHELWTFIQTDLEKRNLWSPTYVPLLQGMVDTIARLQEINRVIDKEGVMIPRYNIKGEQVGEMAHPLLAQQNSFQNTVLKFIERLGMSPKDIVFLMQTDPVNEEQIVQDAVTVKKGVQYFR